MENIFCQALANNKWYKLYEFSWNHWIILQKRRENKKSNTNNCKNVHKPTHRNGMSKSTHYLSIYIQTHKSIPSGYSRLCNVKFSSFVLNKRSKCVAWNESEFSRISMILIPIIRSDNLMWIEFNLFSFIMGSKIQRFKQKSHRFLSHLFEATGEEKKRIKTRNQLQMVEVLSVNAMPSPYNIRVKFYWRCYNINTPDAFSYFKYAH